MPDAINLNGFWNFSKLKTGSSQRQNRIAASCLLPCNAAGPTKSPYSLPLRPTPTYLLK